MNKKQIHVFLIIVLLFGLSFIILLPLFRPGFLVTDDGNWMIIRLSAFYQTLREGQFPVRFLGRLNQSYGYPVANFLYPGFMYIGSLLHALGLSFQTSVEAIIVGSVLLGSCFTYFWLRRIFSQVSSIAGAIMYVLMPYLLFDIFKRGSVGEVLAIGLMPVALFSIESKNKWLLAPIVALLAISHNTLAVFFLPFLFGYILLKKYWNVLPHFIFGVGMTSFFWLPAFFERTYVTFDSIAISNPGSYFPISHTIILWSVPLLFSALFLLFKDGYHRSKEFWYVTIIFCLSTFFATKGSAFLWRVADFVKFVQFPFRWLAFFTFLGPWLVAAAISEIKKGKIVFIICGVLLLIGSWVTTYFKSESIIQPEGYFTTNEATTTVKDEYMPKWATKQMKERSTKRIEFFKGQGTIEEKVITTQRIDVVIHAKEESVIQLNTIYYPGWGAMLDGEKGLITYENEYGLMRLSMPAGDHQLFMEFRETFGRFLADLLSAAFGVMYGISLIILIVKSRNKKKRRYKEKNI